VTIRCCLNSSTWNGLDRDSTCFSSCVIRNFEAFNCFEAGRDLCCHGRRLPPWRPQSRHFSHADFRVVSWN
jgi:hypothetical protein